MINQKIKVLAWCVITLLLVGGTPTPTPTTTPVGPLVGGAGGTAAQIDPYIALGLFVSLYLGLYGISRLIIDRTKHRIRTLIFAFGALFVISEVYCLYSASTDHSYYLLVFAIFLAVVSAFFPSVLTANDKNKKEEELKTLNEKSDLADFNKVVLEKLNIIDAQTRIISCMIYEKDYDAVADQIKHVLGKIMLEDIKWFIETKNDKGKKDKVGLSLFLVDEMRPGKKKGFIVLADTYLSTTEKDKVESDFYWENPERNKKVDYMGVASYAAATCKTVFISELASQSELFWDNWVNVDDEKNEKRGTLYCRPIFEGQAESKEGEDGNRTLVVINVTCPTPLDGTIIARFIDIYSRNIVALVYLYKCVSQLQSEPE